MYFRKHLAADFRIQPEECEILQVRFPSQPGVGYTKINSKTPKYHNVGLEKVCSFLIFVVKPHYSQNNIVVYANIL